MTATTEEVIRRSWKRSGEPKDLDREDGAAHRTRFKWYGPHSGSMGGLA